MAFEHKENTATVFSNDKKSAENQPDFTGKVKQARNSWTLLCGDANQKPEMNITT